MKKESHILSKENFGLRLSGQSVQANHLWDNYFDLQNLYFVSFSSLVKELFLTVSEACKRTLKSHQPGWVTFLYSLPFLSLCFSSFQTVAFSSSSLSHAFVSPFPLPLCYVYYYYHKFFKIISWWKLIVRNLGGKGNNSTTWWKNYF